MLCDSLEQKLKSKKQRFREKIIREGIDLNLFNLNLCSLIFTLCSLFALRLTLIPA
jgi:hypothetical protein